MGRKPLTSSEATPATQTNILIVGDDQATALALRNSLSSSGFLVQTASNFKEALLLLDSCPCDLIIGDFERPTVDGVSFFASARVRSGKRSLPPILLLRDSPEDEQMADQLGVADALSKPIDLTSLLDAVTKITSSLAL
ncbi:MAG: response regulator [Anaerolineae bacterium]